jgi:hypothetical protein
MAKLIVGTPALPKKTATQNSSDKQHTNERDTALMMLFHFNSP